MIKLWVQVPPRVKAFWDLGFIPRVFESRRRRADIEKWLFHCTCNAKFVVQFRVLAFNFMEMLSNGQDIGF